MKNIGWKEFKKIEIRIGTIIEVKDFPESIKPAYQLKVDLGKKIGIKKSSAQITDLYSKKELFWARYKTYTKRSILEQGLLYY